MKLNRLFAFFVVALFSVSCYEEYTLVAPYDVCTDASFEEMFPEAKQITIAELKYAYGNLNNTGANSGWSNTVSKVIGKQVYDCDFEVEPKVIFPDEELYIKGKVISDDTEGNVYKTLYIQDETSGIEIKLNNNVGLRYKKGTWVYVRLTGLYLGNYRMMLSLGGPPSESWNKANEHKFYANSNIELQSIIDEHVFAGESAGEFKVGSYEEWLLDPESVDIITVTPDNYLEVFKTTKVKVVGRKEVDDKPVEFQMTQRELMYGRLMRFEDIQCRYAGVPSFKFDENGDIVLEPVDKDGDGENDLNEDGYPILEPVIYTNPALKSGSFDNIYPSWLYTDPRPTVSKGWYHWAFKEEITGRSLYGSVCFTYNPEATVCSAHGLYTLRTSGYSRFARQNVCKDGSVATITAIYGIYSKNTDYSATADDYASYQLTISSINDIVFKNGEKALLTDAQVEALTTEDMKLVPWIDDYEEGGE